ncbi:hypothetical protein ACFL6G_00605 [candidate division KSB1 bacterium]
MSEIWFQRLFKFDSLKYAEGEIVLQIGNFIFLIVPFLLAIAAAVLITYFISKIYLTRGSKLFSLSIRIIVLLLLFIPLFEPVLMVPDIIPEENFLVVMVDKSMSMGIKDGNEGLSRLEEIRGILENEETGILDELEQNFKVRYYEFGSEASRVDSINFSTTEETKTNISSALQRVISDFKGLPLTGIVFFSDGGDNSRDDPFASAEELRGLDIPVHIIGVGSEKFDNERELVEVNAGKGLSEGTGAEIDMKIRSWINETAPVDITIYKDGEPVHSETRSLKGNGKIDYLSFFYEPQEKGAAEYTVKINEIENEINTDNNSQNFLINSQKDSIRVLYFEGHIRNEFKYLKRALQEDQIVEFTSVSRTGTGKYYRQGIRTPDELAGGFPEKVEDLKKFKAVVFGDVEASYFTIEQLRMVEEFVRVRGGGFLMLGGLNSFSEGNYINTPIADLLPVNLDPERRQILATVFHDPLSALADTGGYRFVPTRVGLENPILKLTSDVGSNRASWDEMPKLTSINYLGEVKPGATVLAEKPRDRYGEPEPLLVTHRYGKGRAAVLATASTWRWQLQREAGDQRHERFWRQLVRWMITSAPDKVNLDLADNVFSPGDEIPLSVKVYDDDYSPLEFVTVRGTIKDPQGLNNEISFRSDLNEDGVYIGTYIPGKEGLYDISVEAFYEERSLGKKDQKFLIRPSKKEYNDATLKKVLLQNIAEISSGEYYEQDNTQNILTNLRTRKTSTSIFRTEFIWDLPLIYVIILILLSTEWIYRRRKGMP